MRYITPCPHCGIDNQIFVEFDSGEFEGNCLKCGAIFPIKHFPGFTAEDKTRLSTVNIQSPSNVHANISVRMAQLQPKNMGWVYKGE